MAEQQLLYEVNSVASAKFEDGPKTTELKALILKSHYAQAAGSLGETIGALD